MNGTNNYLMKTFTILILMAVSFLTVMLTYGQKENRTRFSTQITKAPIVINRPNPTEYDLLAIAGAKIPTDNLDVIFIGSKNGLLKYFYVQENTSKISLTSVSMNQTPIRQIHFDETGYLIKGSAIYRPEPIGVWAEYFDYQKSRDGGELIPEFWQIGFSAPFRACLVGVNLRKDSLVDGGLLLCNPNLRQNPNNWTKPRLPETDFGAKITNQLTSIHFKGERGWLVGANGVIWQTENGGSEWRDQESNTESSLLSVFAAERDDVWAVGFGSTVMHYSRNEENSEKLNSDPDEKSNEKNKSQPNKQTPKPKNPNSSGSLDTLGSILGQTTIIVGSKDNKQKSDKPEWRPVKIKNMPANIRLWSVKFAEDGRNGWIIGDAGTIFYTRDSGQTWEKINLIIPSVLPKNLPNLYAMHIDNRSCWIVGSQGVILRLDY